MLYKSEANKAKKMIAEQSEQLNKKSEQKVSAIRLLYNNGMDKNKISQNLVISIDEVEKALTD